MAPTGQVTFSPRDAADLGEIVAGACANGQALAVAGGGSKRGWGYEDETTHVLVLDALRGIRDYQPAELVITAGAATPLAEVEATLAAQGQMLAFEPPDWRALFATTGASPTLGGMIACNVAGPRRIKAGAARDHFLGVAAVNGRGEIFKAGGKVLKNVTGYDLCKLLAGSHGTLAILSEVTLKVLPRPERTRTLLVRGLDDVAAVRALGSGLAGPYEVSGAAHLPASAAPRLGLDAIAGTVPVTALRLEGFAASVTSRAAAVRQAVAAFAAADELDDMASTTFWHAVGAARPVIAPDRAIWRLSLPPTAAPAVVEIINRGMDAVSFYDWGGGLVWIGVAGAADGGEQAVRAALAGSGGHATLLRAPESVSVRDIFQPLPPPLAALAARVKQSFDPARILNPGRMYRGV